MYHVGCMPEKPHPAPLPEGTLALAIPSHNRAPMLERIVGEILPTCEALAVDVHVSDNGSTDDTPAVCARLARASRRFHFQRHDPAITLERNLMATMAQSAAEYTWAVGDDDYVLPSALEAAAQILRTERPSAIVLGTTQVAHDGAADLSAPVLAQVAHLGPEAYAPPCAWNDAAALFRDKFYDLPLRAVIYKTRAELAADYARYYGTHHPHIGGLFEYLATEQAENGCVQVLHIPEVCTVSLTVMHHNGKETWSDLFEEIAKVGFPRWFSLLPPLYAPHIEAGLAYHRHIFRHVLDPS
jgi:glycosyltransferase involved in cell wall biosynthesis